MLKLNSSDLSRKEAYYTKSLKSYKKFTVNTEQQQIDYLAGHFLGKAKRYGWKTVLPTLELHQLAEEIKARIRQMVGKG